MLHLSNKLLILAVIFSVVLGSPVQSQSIIDKALDKYVDGVLRQNNINPNSSTGKEVKRLIRQSARGKQLSYNDVKNLVDIQLNEIQGNARKGNRSFRNRITYSIDKELGLTNASPSSRRRGIQRVLKAPVAATKIRRILSLAAESMKAGAKIAVIPAPSNTRDKGVDPIIAHSLTWDVYEYFDLIMEQNPSHSLKPYQSFIQQGSWPLGVLKHFHRQNLSLEIKTPVMREKRNVYTVDGSKFCSINGIIYRNSGIVFGCEDGGSWCLSSPSQDPGICD